MAPAGPSNRCLYEILGVSRDCSAEEIRSAYKKQALRLHPDKVAQSAGGATDDAEATAAFQELQLAYDVLRDPKERAWYDAHRSQILFASNRTPASSGDPNPSSAGAGDGFFSSFFSRFASASSFKSPMDDLGNIYSFFSASAFSGFSDTGRGFYKVYGDLFDKIYSNEVFFAKEVLGGDPDDALDPPPLMGNLESPYEQWTAFYNYWSGFSTVMDFSWADMYDVREAINRKVRREMEELNKKVRKKMRKEYNDTVRSLAAFVKKRDKRMVEMLIRKKAAEQERKEELRKKKEEEKKKKDEKARLYREAEWAQIDEEVDEEILYDGWYGPEANDKTKAAKGGEELYCVVCGKKFKSDKQWKNHEQSKKHRDKVAELRESLQGEDDTLNGTDDDVEEEGVHVSFDYVQEPSEDSENSVVNGLCGEFDDGFGFREEATDNVISELGEGVGLEDEANVVEAMASNHKSRKAVCVEQPDLSPTNASHHDIEVGNCREYETGKKDRKSRLAKKGIHSKPDAVDARAEVTDENPGDDEVRRHKDNAERMKESSSYSFHEVGSSLRGQHNLGKNRKPKKQQVDGNFAIDKDTGTATKCLSKGKKQKGAVKAPSNACGTCGESFDSRNKLFVHLGETGHAMLKSR